MYSFFRLLLLVAVIFLLTTFFVFEKNLVWEGKKETVSPISASGIIKGQVLDVKNGTLTIKTDENGEVKIKLLTQASILKQVRLTPYSTGSEPSQVNKGNMVSVITAKNSQGELETSSVVILDENLDKISTPSSPAKKE